MMKIRFIPKYSCCPLCESREIVPDFSLMMNNERISWFLCKRCDLVFQNPRLDEKSIHEVYASEFYWGKKVIEGCSAYRNYIDYDYLRIQQSRTRLKKIMSITGFRTGKLLDVGCATGFFGFVAQEQGFQVTGIEPSPEMSNYGQKEYDLDIMCTTLENASLDKEYYDLVTLWGTDSHFLHPLKGFAKLSDTLKSGGFLVMNYQNFHHWIRLFFPGLKKSWNALYNFSDKSMDFLLRKLDFNLVYRKIEWQWVSWDHFFRLIKSSSPKFLERKVVLLPAISFRLIIVEKK